MIIVHVSLAGEEQRKEYTPDQLVALGLAAGWTWEDVHGYSLLVPPPGDKRRGWCARWIPYGEKQKYPSYISQLIGANNVKPDPHMAE